MKFAPLRAAASTTRAGLGGAPPTDSGTTSTRSTGLTTTEKARRRIQEQHLPNLPLITQDGQRVRFYDDLVKGKVVSVNFFFAKCDEVCPVVMANLAKVQKLLGDQVGRNIFMYSITLKPEEDTVAFTVDSFPRYFVLSKDGIILAQFKGWNHDSDAAIKAATTQGLAQ